MLENEINKFDSEFQLLNQFVNNLEKIDKSDIGDQEYFLAESVLFRIYRASERLNRASFLNYCVVNQTFLGNPVTSKLICPDWDTAEEILKSGNKFMDWGNVTSIRKMSNLIFQDGFPISEYLAQFASILVDLQRFRNFIAHDSKEAETGFKNSRTHYVKKGDTPPNSVGELCLYRKTLRSSIVIKIIHKKTSNLGIALKQQ